MMTFKEIKEKIGKKNDCKTINDYNGFDMSKTHSQEEINKLIDKHNKSVLELFVTEKESEKIMKHLDCWKGGMIWGDDWNLFAGWNTEDIIYWILTDGKIDWDKNNIEEIPRIVTREQRYEVLKRQKWRCNICNSPLKFNLNSNWKGEIAHIDHIHPFSKKDTYHNGKENINELSNLQALCPKCNLSKNKKQIN